MADEQAPIEQTIPVEAAPEQSEDTVLQEATDEATPSQENRQDDPSEKGNYQMAMFEERRRRQELEQRARDPQWVYEQAKALGLAGDDADSPAPQAEQQRTPDVASTVEHLLDFRETVKQHPELDPKTGNPALVRWAAALVDGGARPSEAAEVIFGTIGDMTKSQAKAQANESLAEKAKIEALKLSSSLVDGAHSAPDDGGKAELEAQAKNWKNPKAQEKAILELQKLRMSGR